MNIKNKYRNIVSIVIIKISYFLVIIRSFLIIITNAVTLYQNYSFFFLKFGRRNSDIRIHAILNQLKLLQLTENYSVLDIGCNSGYITNSVVGKDSIGIGIDYTYTNVLLASKYHYKNKMLNFLSFKITPNNILCLPSSDVVIFLSLFHHFCIFYGFLEACKMFEVILTKTNKVLFFETGHSGETSKWSSHVSNIDDNNLEWLDKLCMRNNFNKPLELIKSDTTVSSSPRKMYAIIRND